MPVTVRLDDIVEALETLVDESPSYWTSTLLKW